MMRHFLSFLISLIIHIGVLYGIWISANHVEKKNTSVAIEAVNFDIGIMVAAKVADNTGPQKSEDMKAKTNLASVTDQTEAVEEEVEEVAEPIVEEKVAVPEPIIKPKPIVKPKPKPKKKVKKKPKPKKKTKKKTEKKVVKKPIKAPPTESLSDLFSNSSHGGGAQSANSVKNSGSSSASEGGKGSSKGGSANANAYGSSLRAAIARIANKNYPRAAKRMRKQGTVTVRFNLARDGQISGVTVVGSSGNGVLDEGAIKAVRRLGKYKPPPPNFGSTVTIPIRFRLR